MLVDILNYFRWQDALDIALVTFIIYKTLSLLAGTRAIQLVKGLFVLALLWTLARWFNLDTFEWLLSRLFSALLIIIPIIFQPELRPILVELGRGSMWRQSKARKRAEEIADEMCSGLMYCSTHKIGALIVLQRETGLKDYWRNAVLLDAEITNELLIAVFWPNNPLHDGAMIIDGERVLAAGCYLPLTEDAELSRWLGTRHRAAIGVTEVSDAVSLIVSEERGEISLAINGKLSRDLNETQLRKYLIHYFTDQGREQGFMENLKEELMALGSEKEPDK